MRQSREVGPQLVALQLLLVILLTTLMRDYEVLP